MGASAMSEEERARLAELMARLGAGDTSAMWDLHAEFGPRLAAQMRQHVRAVNARPPSEDELEGMVLDGWFALRECAASWDPEGGALPWNWARQRLRKVATDWVGQFADELDETFTIPSSSHVVDVGDDDRGVLLVLDDLAERDEIVALFRDALELVASERDRVVLLEVGVQQVLGDPSPSHTVGALLDLSAPAVRKAKSRTLSRVRTLAETDERFARLLDLGLAA